jgi:hypothetical protein
MDIHSGHRWYLSFSILVLTASSTVAAEKLSFLELGRFDAPEAGQAVAVDAEFFYAIGNRVVAKYRKESGRVDRRWTASTELPLEHLKSGVVTDGRLYCAHSNFPHYPETSSVEVWETESLRHITKSQLGILRRVAHLDRPTRRFLVGYVRPLHGESER